MARPRSFQFLNNFELLFISMCLFKTANLLFFPGQGQEVRSGHHDRGSQARPKTAKSVHLALQLTKVQINVRPYLASSSLWIERKLVSI